MNWVSAILLASLLWAVATMINKFALAKEFKSFIPASIVTGFGSAAVFMLITPFLGEPFDVKPIVIIVGILAGAIYKFANIFSFIAYEYGDASQVSPLLNTQALFVLVLSYFMFGETFMPKHYLGIALVLFGAIMISYNKNHPIFTPNKLLLAGIFASVIYSVRNVIIKYGTDLQTDIWSLMFWIGLGIGLSTMSLLFLHRPKFSDKNKQGVKHLLLNVIIGFGGFALMTEAFANGPATLVSTVMLVQIVFVFLMAIVLSKYHPEIIKESTDKKTLIRKGIAIAILIVGLILVI